MTRPTRWGDVDSEAVRSLYDDYAHHLDRGEFDRWLELFTEGATYQAVARENHERGLPLATIRCDSRDMLADRIDAVVETQFYARRLIRHFTSALRPAGRDGAALATTANFLVVETLLDEGSQVHSVGEYRDVVVLDGDELRFAAKVAIYDAPLVPTSLVIPL